MIESLKMPQICETLVKQMDQMLRDPQRVSFGYAAQRIFDEGYLAGRSAVQRELRIKLGLETEDD
jgi:hypothetical protein